MPNGPTATDPSLYSFVAAKIQSLYKRYNAGSAAARRELSNLRRAVGKDPGNHPLAWQFVLSEDTAGGFPSLRDDERDMLSHSEYAAYLALTLYAVHQQSEQRIMHAKDKTFGHAVGQLVAERTPSIKKRFDALLQARSFPAIAYHARTLVQLLKQEEIPFNYAKFAEDLSDLQNPKDRSRVVARWSRDFVVGYSSLTNQTKDK